ncbi:hypothetical protein AACH00_15575 [Ideonella sp. LYT19W]|uniref:ElaB/YqjD/DUF883 family membrane-anchored ribosome-binding protein n=2 Tax=Ideonella margarita TaxID=2984191 RepID=A0ABU9C800_9BURK
MSTNHPSSSPTVADKSSQMLDAAVRSADHAIDGTRHLANSSLDHLAQRLDTARASAGNALDGLATDASRIAESGSNAIRAQATEWRHQADQARQGAQAAIRHAPLKSVMLAAATGAAVMLLSQWLGRGRTR